MLCSGEATLTQIFWKKLEYMLLYVWHLKYILKKKKKKNQSPNISSPNLTIKFIFLSNFWFKKTQIVI